MYTMRFDMRAPANGAPAPDLYRAAMEMCAWGEGNGALATIVCEHHGSPDGYLPSPLILATAIAARTETLPIMIAIFMAPLYNPVRLAEEMVVLDNISRGRVSYIGGIGYVPAEYEMHGVDFKRRGAIADEILEIVLKGKTGEAFEHNGRRIKVTPPPFTPGGPRVGWGGGSAPAARRAGRHGIDFLAERGEPELADAYQAACQEFGRQPANVRLNRVEDAAVVFVADDVEAAWKELGPYIMNDVRGYAVWNEGRTGTSSVSFAKSVEELRAENRSHRIFTVEQARAHVASGLPLPLHPIIGGLPPDIAWRYLKTAADVARAPQPA